MRAQIVTAIDAWVSHQIQFAEVTASGEVHGADTRHISIIDRHRI
jgi:hypothetical protein